MRWATIAAAVEAAATGLILLIAPVLFGRLIFGAELSEPGQGAWPAHRHSPARFRVDRLAHPSARSVTRALLGYNLLAILYLCYLAIAGKLVGALLWPAIALHLVLSSSFGARSWLAARAK